MTYEVGVPPGEAAHVRTTVEPDTVATSEFGGPGGATVSAACSRPGSACQSVAGAAHAGFATAALKMPCAAELVRQFHDRSAESPVCAWLVVTRTIRSVVARKHAAV